MTSPAEFRMNKQMEREARIAGRTGGNTLYPSLDAIVAAEPRVAIPPSLQVVEGGDAARFAELAAPARAVVAAGMAETEQPQITPDRGLITRMAMADRTLEAMQNQINALEKIVEKMDERVAALVENVNLLRGDRQRVEAENAPPKRRGRPPNVINGADIA